MPVFAERAFHDKFRKSHKSLRLGDFRLKTKGLGSDFDSRHLHQTLKGVEAGVDEGLCVILTQ